MKHIFSSIERYNSCLNVVCFEQIKPALWKKYKGIECFITTVKHQQIISIIKHLAEDKYTRIEYTTKAILIYIWLKSCLKWWYSLIAQHLSGSLNFTSAWYHNICCIEYRLWFYFTVCYMTMLICESYGTPKLLFFNLN